MQVKRADVPLALEDIGLPLNTFGPKNPFTGKVVSVEKVTGAKATGETYHIIIQTDGKIPFVEGQSYGVIPPGTKINSKGKEVPHGTRLYSIAATRYGDSFDGETVRAREARARAGPGARAGAGRRQRGSQHRQAQRLNRQEVAEAQLRHSAAQGGRGKGE